MVATLIQGLEEEGNTLFDPKAPGTPANKITEPETSKIPYYAQGKVTVIAFQPFSN
jgi:hypothetical protein